MEGTDKRKTAEAVYVIYCIYGIFTWCISNFINWSKLGMFLFAVGAAVGGFLTFRKKFKAEMQAYFITISASVNIWIFSIDTREFTETFTVICALACLLSFYHIPKINYFHLINTTLFILYKLFTEQRFWDITKNQDFLVILRIFCIYLVEIVMIILVKWHMEALKTSQEKTEEAELACQAKADFLANMSHEIRTPMNVINGMTELIMQKELSDEEKEYVYGIHTAGENLLAIINDILDFSKMESGELELSEEPYETMSFFYDISNITKVRLGEKKVELLVDINPKLPVKLIGDVLRLKQVTLNLLTNAVKYTEQGQIVLRADFKKTEEGIDLMISVKDSGIGIRDEDMEKLFRAFGQLDAKRSRAVEGTGLGLAISKEIISLMGGNLQFESTFGEGSDFHFTVPQKVADESPCAVVKDKEKIYLGIYAEDKDTRDAIIQTADQLKLVYKEITDRDSILRTVHEEGINHLFLDCTLGSSFEDFLKLLPKGTAVLISEDVCQSHYEEPNVYVVKKPIYSMVLASALNHKEPEREVYEKEIHRNRTRFRAPAAAVLIVDDNAVNLKVATGLLRSYEMQLDTAVSGGEAIDKVTEKKYDLVLMDHMMPGMDGVEATQRIRQMPEDYYQKLPIIALSANAVHGAQEMFLSAGMNDFVAKPIEMRILAEKLLKWLPEDKIIRGTEETDGSSPNIHIEDTDAATQENILQRAEERDNQESRHDEAEEPDSAAYSIENMEFPEIDGMDYETGLNYVGGDEALYREVVFDYADSAEERALTIEACLTENDLESYTLNVHALKGVSRTIGAFEVGRLAMELEESGKNGDWEKIRKATPLLLQKYRELGRKLKGQPAGEDTGHLPITGEALKEKLQRLLDLLEEYDSIGAEEVLKDMERYDYPKYGMRELLHKMKEEMNQFNYDSCKEAVRQMYEYI